MGLFRNLQRLSHRVFLGVWNRDLKRLCHLFSTLFLSFAVLKASVCPVWFQRVCWSFVDLMSYQSSFFFYFGCKLCRYFGESGRLLCEAAALLNNNKNTHLLSQTWFLQVEGRQSASPDEFNPLTPAFLKFFWRRHPVPLQRSEVISKERPLTPYWPRTNAAHMGWGGHTNYPLIV